MMMMMLATDAAAVDNDDPDDDDDDGEDVDDDDGGDDDDDAYAFAPAVSAAYHPVVTNAYAEPMMSSPAVTRTRIVSASYGRYSWLRTMRCVSCATSPAG